MDNSFRFKKKYGQNFLKNTSIIEKMISKVNIDKNSLVIEVGPGSGALTKFLVKNAKYVLAYEIDNELKSILEDNFSNTSNVEFIFGDFLDRNIEKDIEKYDVDNIL